MVARYDRWAARCNIPSHAAAGILCFFCSCGIPPAHVGEWKPVLPESKGILQ